ncbi:helix-turn-helix domain-containing protein [Salmonella enterica]|nr:helix-turn-helix domain-containing protein [Salmonella enterica]ECC3907875.1 helix-turn-helix domain-containing protein [Salmonella enterica]
MFVSPETDSESRRKQINRDAEKERREHENAKKNSKFTQVSPKGWERVRELLMDKQGISALKLYSFLAEHIDPSCGAVVADQQFLADKMDVSRTTIIRWLNYLESKNALVRIPVAGKVCAYALDPHEVWKGYNTTKDYAAFRTKTLVNTDGDIKRRIMAMFSPTDAPKGIEGDTPEAE